MKLRTILIALALGCGTNVSAQPSGADGYDIGERRAPLFVSPAGRVYRLAPGTRGAPPLAAWFGAADGNGDGAIDWAEFLADFLATFGELDRDGDGEIEPEEVTHYETAVLPEMSARAGGLGGRRGAMGGGMRRGDGGRGGMSGMRSGGGGRGGGGLAARFAGAARFSLLPIPHPIMAADADFNRGVTRAEYERAAASRFAMLNNGGDGRLTLDELRALRPQAQRRGGERRPARGN